MVNFWDIKWVINVNTKIIIPKYSVERIDRLSGAFEQGKIYVTIDKNSSNESQKKDLEHYIKNPIEYKLNNYGFRTYDDLDSSEGNVYLGCSFTYGEGHHLENTWSYKLHKLPRKAFRWENYEIIILKLYNINHLSFII